jgi:uncharacterized protein YaiE (UPF0345 family)
MGKKDKILIKGIDVTSQVVNARFVINDDIRREDDATINLSPEVLTLIPKIKINDVVKYYRGESVANVQRWTGYISGIDNQAGTIIISCSGEFTRIDRKEVNKTYDQHIDPEAGVISAIASDIMTDGGVTPDVEDSGTTNVFSVFPCRREIRSRKLKELANVLRWACFYDHNNETGIFKPKGNIGTGVSVVVGVYPLINAPIWEENDKQLFNQFTVEGLEVRVGRTDWFSGDGVQTEYELKEYPVSVNAVWSGSANFKTTRPTDTDLMVGGADEVTSDIDYSWREESKILTFKVGSVPSNNTFNVQVEYNYNEALPGFFVDETSQTLYDVREKTVTALYLTNAFDVDELGMSLLKEYSYPKVTTRLLLGNDLSEFPQSQDLYVNKTLHVADSQSPRNINKTLTINKLILNYPEPYDEVDVGEHMVDMDDFLERTIDRIKKLEDRFKSQGGLRQYRFFNGLVEFPAQLDVYTALKEADYLYWDDDDQGDWDDFDWADDDDEDTTLVRRVHHPAGFMLFDLYDDYLVDTASTTATVSTTNGTVTFTNGQVFITEILFLNNQAYYSLLLELQDSEISNIGNLSFGACANGNTNTWETITPESEHSFVTSTTAGIKLRVVASGNATINFKSPTSLISTPWRITVK